MPPKKKSNPTFGGAKGDSILGSMGDTSLLNDTKIFAGLMIILLNISSKYVKIKLSPSIEAFLKTSVSMYFLIFIMIWVGIKDLISSIVITLVCILLIEYLLNEESAYCILPESFTQQYGGGAGSGAGSGGGDGTASGGGGTAGANKKDKPIKPLTGDEIDFAIDILKSIKSQ